MLSAFDSIFAQYAGALPVAYLRALSTRESNLNPNEQKMPAYGLMQVVGIVREAYNERFGTNYSQPQLLDPSLNVAIASDLLNRIAAQYAKHSDKNMKPNWRNPEFVKLLTAGWNSGYSEAGGVGKVATFLESRGLPVTHDNVFKYASQAGATKHLSNDTKYNWQRSVADLYFQQGDAPSAQNTAEFGYKIAAAVGAGLLVAKLAFK